MGLLVCILVLFHQCDQEDAKHWPASANHLPSVTLAWTIQSTCKVWATVTQWKNSLSLCNQAATCMLSACNYPPVSYLIWFATCNASMSQLQWETCSTLRMGQTNNRVTWSCVCLLSENDSWQSAGSGATALSCLLSYSQHQAGRSMARVGRFLNVNWCHEFKYKSFFFFEWSENRLCRQYACIFCGHLFLFVYVWKTSCWPCIRLWHCSITTVPQMLTDNYELESNHVSSYILFTPHLILIPLPLLLVAWPFQIKLIPLLIHSHKALTWSKVACSFDTQWQKSEAFS